MPNRKKRIRRFYLIILFFCFRRDFQLVASLDLSRVSLLVQILACILGAQQLIDMPPFTAHQGFIFDSFYFNGPSSIVRTVNRLTTIKGVVNPTRRRSNDAPAWTALSLRTNPEVFLELTNCLFDNIP